MTEYSRTFVTRMRRELLSHTTDAERCAARNCERLGYKVIRQQPIATGRRLYFADIYIPEIKTIVEADGGYHYTTSQKRRDGNRSAGIWRLGYHVVRLSNHDCRDIAKIRAKIELILHKIKKTQSY